MYNACTVNHMYCAVIELPCAPASCEWPASISDQFLVIAQYSSKILKHWCAFPLPRCWFGYYSHLSAPKYVWLNTGEGEGLIWVRKKGAMIECKKQCLFQRFVMSIVASIRSLRSMDRSFQARSFHLILHPVIPLRDLQLMKLISTVSNFIFILTFPNSFPLMVPLKQSQQTPNFFTEQWVLYVHRLFSHLFNHYHKHWQLLYVTVQ